MAFHFPKETYIGFIALPTEKQQMIPKTLFN